MATIFARWAVGASIGPAILLMSTIITSLWKCLENTHERSWHRSLTLTTGTLSLPSPGLVIIFEPI